MRKWFHILLLLLIVNIVIILIQYFYFLKKVNDKREYIGKIELIVYENDIKIQELNSLKSHIGSIELSLDTILNEYHNHKEATKKSLDDKKSIKKQITGKSQVNRASIDIDTIMKEQSPDSVRDEINLGSNKQEDKNIVANTNKINFNSSGVFNGITSIYNKKRDEQLIKQNDRFLWIELESKYSLLDEAIKKVTINKYNTEIIEIKEEEKKSIGRKVKFTYLLSYFILIKVDQRTLVVGNNEITVYADIKYSKTINIMK